ncbi:response regulator transcription factor [Microbacterium gorillae]|uniref:response regulator transcription factor n=1 Tax=Microbacterium gorillae TaxID=1231063 RepID=UPI00058C7433|nr:response regulator transcription factor [Microbacterium gorillae]
MIHRRPRVLYVEDDAVIAEMTRDVLAEANDVVWESTVAAARTAAHSEAFDVLVLDRRLPGGDGLELLRELRGAGVRTPALMLTALDSVADRVAGLDGGANDYLVKPFDFDELLARVRALHRGAAVADRIEVGAWVLVPGAQAMYGPGGERVALTATEARLMGVLAREPDRVFSRAELLTAVFDHTDTLGTVDTYVHYLRRKTAPEVVTTVRARGYRVGG